MDFENRPAAAKLDIADVNDEMLLLKIQEGDHEAFSTLVYRHTERFYRIAYRMLFNKDNAEDIVQEAFLKLWERPNMWDGNRQVKFTTWFYRIVTNLCLDHNRKKGTLPLTEVMEHADNRQGPEASLENAQHKALMDRLIGELPDRQQLALNLCFYEGLSNKEASEIVGVKLKALQSLLMRARTTLKEKVQQYRERGLL